MLLTWGWAISIMVLLGMKLARIKLDDQLLLDGLIHVVASRLRGAFRGHVVFVKAEPRHNRPLLAAQLDAIVGDLAAAHLGVHAWRHSAPVERALGVALLAFQKELHAFAAAVTADGALILTH